MEAHDIILCPKIRTGDQDGGSKARDAWDPVGAYQYVLLRECECLEGSKVWNKWWSHRTEKAMDDIEIMHMFQPTSDTLDLASRWISKMSQNEWQTTNQLQFVSLGILAEVLSEPEVAGGVKDEGERVVRCGGNTQKRDDVWMRQLSVHQNLCVVSLEQNLNHGVQERKMIASHPGGTFNGTGLIEPIWF
jgi:hypothetical protein